MSAVERKKGKSGQRLRSDKTAAAWHTYIALSGFFYIKSNKTKTYRYVEHKELIPWFKKMEIKVFTKKTPRVAELIRYVLVPWAGDVPTRTKTYPGAMVMTLRAFMLIKPWTLPPNTTNDEIQEMVNALRPPPYTREEIKEMARVARTEKNQSQKSRNRTLVNNRLKKMSAAERKSEKNSVRERRVRIKAAAKKKCRTYIILSNGKSGQKDKTYKMFQLNGKNISQPNLRNKLTHSEICVYTQLTAGAKRNLEAYVVPFAGKTIALHKLNGASQGVGDKSVEIFSPDGTAREVPVYTLAEFLQLYPLYPKVV